MLDGGWWKWLITSWLVDKYLSHWPRLRIPSYLGYNLYLKQISTISVFAHQHGTINLVPTLPKPQSVLTSLPISTLRGKQGGRAGFPSRPTARVPWLFRFLLNVGRTAITSLPAAALYPGSE